MDPQYINPKNLKHRSDVTVWNGVAYVAGIVPSDNTLSIAEQTRQALAVIDGHLAAVRTDKSRLLSLNSHDGCRTRRRGLQRRLDRLAHAGTASHTDLYRGTSAAGSVLRDHSDRSNADLIREGNP